MAWTSDTRQQWAAPWIGTDAFGTLAAQLVAWTLPPQDEQGIDVRFSPGRDGELNVEVTSLDDDGAPRNFYRTVLRLVAPDLAPLQSTLTQVGPGRYAGTVRADQPGAYLVRVAQTLEGADSANRTLGSSRPPRRSSDAWGSTARRSPATPEPARGARSSSTRGIRRSSGKSGATTSPRLRSPPRSGRGSSCWR